MADRESPFDDLSPDQLDELHGVRVEHVEVREDGRVVLVFGHRGTDDGSGYLVVDPADVHFAEASS